MATAVCDPLWGSTPIITLTASSSVAFDEAAVGTPDYGSLCGRTSFEPHLGEIPASQQLVRKPDSQADGRHIESQPARTPRRYGSPRRRARHSIRHVRCVQRMRQSLFMTVNRQL